MDASCPIDTVVKTGMIIEIITGNTKGPNRDWLKVVKTSEARNKIRAWFKKEKREENIAAGREELEKEFRRSSISLTEQPEEEFLAYLAEKQQMKNVDDFLAAIGYGGISLAEDRSPHQDRLCEDVPHLRGGKGRQACPSWCRRSPRCPAASLSRGWTAVW